MEAQVVARGENLPRYKGREVTLIKPELDANGFPVSPAMLCLEGLPHQACYTAPEGFGKSPTVMIIKVREDMPALFFSVANTGVSGWGVHLALLLPEEGGTLKNLFQSRISVSNQSQSAFWNALAISGSQIFVTADYVLGPGEGHFGKHRYMISSYIQDFPEDVAYYLEDQYLTVNNYDLEANGNVLKSEKQEILARLGKVKKLKAVQKQNSR
jgi:hypothetical protein